MSPKLGHLLPSVAFWQDRLAVRTAAVTRATRFGHDARFTPSFGSLDGSNGRRNHAIGSALELLRGIG